MKNYLFQKNMFQRANLFKMLPISLGKGFRGVGPIDTIQKKLIWLGPEGYLSQFKIDPLSYMDRPLDLSNYLLIRTKEKMVLEA